MSSLAPFEGLFTRVNDAISTYVTSTSQDVIIFISPIFTSLLIIWITIWGFSLMLGRGQESLSDGVIKIIKVSFIVALGLTAGTYNTVIVSFFTGFPETIAGVLISGAYTPSDSLDALYEKIFATAKVAWDKAGLFGDGSFGMFFITAAIMIAGCWLLLVTGALILLSKMAMAVLLGVGPIFIIMLLFNSTQRFFESWLSMVINFALIYILATAIGALIITLADTYMNNNSDIATLGGAGSMVVVFAFGVIVMSQVQAIAAALGGGISLATNGMASAMAGKLSPASIRRSGRNVQRNYTASRKFDRAMGRGAMKAGGAVKAAYQKRYGAGNSISK